MCITGVCVLTAPLAVTITPLCLLYLLLFVLLSLFFFNAVHDLTELAAIPPKSSLFTICMQHPGPL